MGEEEREWWWGPVGSTDPVVSRKSHPCTKWHQNSRFEPILALNAGLVPISGV